MLSKSFMKHFKDVGSGFIELHAELDADVAQLYHLSQTKQNTK
jgi:hypothetical protein